LILPQAMAVLYVIAFVGIEAFVLLFKPDIFAAWWRFLKSPFDGRRNSSTTSANPSWIERPPRFAIDRGSMVAVDSPDHQEVEQVVERQDSVVSEGDVEKHAQSERTRRREMEKQYHDI
jgi:hypothetical protein